MRITWAKSTSKRTWTTGSAHSQLYGCANLVLEQQRHALPLIKMPSITPQAVEEVLDRVLKDYRGPGGAVAVLQNGEVLAQRTWGFSDIDQRIPMTADTKLPICSITKQMLCMLLFDLDRHPSPSMARKGNFWEQMSLELHQLLPRTTTQDTGLTIPTLCNNQSGIRDYWAMSTTWGTRPESPFLIATHAPKALDHTRSLHFEPGTQFSYSNTNFHILGRLAERITGKSLGDLINERIFVPAGMKSAEFCPDNNGLPPPCIGYEGDEKHGYVPALNRMQWSGDAGAVATLTDMIAYEKFVDRSWDDPQSLPRTIAAPQKFKDGKPAYYGYGISHSKMGGLETLGHGGALRGYRLERIYAPSERLSVVVMFNHEGDVEMVSTLMLEQLLGSAKNPDSTITPDSNWFGIFFDEQAQLAHEVKNGEKGKVSIDGEPLLLTGPNQAQSRSMDKSASIHGDILSMDVVTDNRRVEAKRVVTNMQDVRQTDYTGVFHNEEGNSTFCCTGTGDLLYGFFDGFLGQGPAHLMRYLGQDIWYLADPRGLDAPAPGDWTVVFERGHHHGSIVGVTVGCWLARKLKFVKKGALA